MNNGNPSDQKLRWAKKTMDRVGFRTSMIRTYLLYAAILVAPLVIWPITGPKQVINNIIIGMAIIMAHMVIGIWRMVTAQQIITQAWKREVATISDEARISIARNFIQLLRSCLVMESKRLLTAGIYRVTLCRIGGRAFSAYLDDLRRGDYIIAVADRRFHCELHPSNDDLLYLANLVQDPRWLQNASFDSVGATIEEQLANPSCHCSQQCTHCQA